MTVETIFPLATTFPAGGSFARFSFLLYGALVSTGLTLLQSLQLVQIRLQNAPNPAGEPVQPLSPGDLVVTTPAGIPALTAPEASAVNSEIALPLPAQVLALAMALQQPGQQLGELRFILDGATVRQAYWDGTSWLRITNNTVIVTPGPPTPGYRGVVSIPLPP